MGGERLGENESRNWAALRCCSKVIQLEEGWSRIPTCPQAGHYENMNLIGCNGVGSEGEIRGGGSRT